MIINITILTAKISGIYNRTANLTIPEIKVASEEI